MEKIKLSLRAVIYRENEVWLAHCLEMDIVTDGATPKEAVSNLIDLVEFKIEDCIEHHNIDGIYRPAPKEYFRLFDQAQKPMRVESLRKRRLFEHRISARQYAIA